MKKTVIAFIISLGGTASYAGNTEKWTLNEKGDKYNIVRNKSTLFISGDNSGQFDIEHAVLLKFPNLPFQLKTN